MKCPNCEEIMSQTMTDEGLCGYCGAELRENDDDDFDEDDEDGDEENGE